MTGQDERIKPDGEVKPMKMVQWTQKILGEGSYGRVLEVKYEETVYAAKQLCVAKAPNFWELFGKEITTLSSLGHPNIVCYHGIGYFPDNKLPLLLMELMKTTLQAYLKENPQCPLQDKIRILVDVSKGLAYLHASKLAIVHGDLTANNVLLDSEMRAKISDFGNSRLTIVESGEQERTFRALGTKEYMPPEALNDHLYSKKLDIFSFGHLALCTVVQNFSCILLPDKITCKDGKFQICSEVDRRREHFEKLSEIVPSKASKLRLLIASCLSNDHSKRPPAKEILSQLENMFDFKSHTSSSYDGITSSRSSHGIR